MCEIPYHSPLLPLSLGFDIFALPFALGLDYNAQKQTNKNTQTHRKFSKKKNSSHPAGNGI